VALFEDQRTHAVDSSGYKAPSLGCVWQLWAETTVALLLDGWYGVLAPGLLQVNGKSPRCPVGRRKRLDGRWSRFGRVVEETDYQKECGSRPRVTSPCPARCDFLWRWSDEHRHWSKAMQSRVRKCTHNYL